MGLVRSKPERAARTKIPNISKSQDRGQPLLLNRTTEEREVIANLPDIGTTVHGVNGNVVRNVVIAIRCKRQPEAQAPDCGREKKRLHEAATGLLEPIEKL
jgi:hypothetical protein